MLRDTSEPFGCVVADADLRGYAGGKPGGGAVSPADGNTGEICVKLPPNIGPDEKVILFDGVCKLCNGWSRFIIQHDTAHRFKLCSVQSDEGQAILAWFGYPTDHYDTMLLVEDGKAFERSDAFLRVVARLPTPWRWLASLRVVPESLRDFLYDRIALNRYRLFGKHEQCVVPSARDRLRFVQGPRVADNE
ncbi:thiol-disulfide oxidoreductase DCC family protein [Nitrogeniibacter aestuarii]|uniref:thiol-disulfide oxidoreductase DCC family protein n=1 Tax=Nitrogeniibacter aestuarii TaxID=2815343 RepID=UPI001E3849B4|nr:thiol-disulfide oxidoreductase DCC family protein [Nitrogeniibacter aestuarii]